MNVPRIRTHLSPVSPENALSRSNRPAAKPLASFRDLLQAQSPRSAPPAAGPAAPTETLRQESLSPAPAQPPVAAVQPAPASPSLHSAAALPNGGLMLNPTGNNALTGGTIAYNPNYYATAGAAAQLAQQLGGTVLDHSGQFSNNQAQYSISLPNGITINAGNLLAVLNNLVYQENSRVMDGKIAELLNNNAVGTPGAGIGLYTVTNGQAAFDPAGRPMVYAT
jgi:hypothetical protein